MPRTRRAYRTCRRVVFLREDIVARVELLLYSEAQGRIPYTAWAGLLEPLLEQYLAKVQEADRLTAEINRETQL